MEVKINAETQEIYQNNKKVWPLAAKAPTPKKVIPKNIDVSKLTIKTPGTSTVADRAILQRRIAPKKTAQQTANELSVKRNIFLFDSNILTERVVKVEALKNNNVKVSVLGFKHKGVPITFTVSKTVDAGKITTSANLLNSFLTQIKNLQASAKKLVDALKKKNLIPDGINFTISKEDPSTILVYAPVADDTNKTTVMLSGTISDNAKSITINEMGPFASKKYQTTVEVK